MRSVKLNLHCIALHVRKVGVVVRADRKTAAEMPNQATVHVVMSDLHRKMYSPPWFGSARKMVWDGQQGLLPCIGINFSVSVNLGNWAIYHCHKEHQGLQILPSWWPLGIVSRDGDDTYILNNTMQKRRLATLPDLSNQYGTTRTEKTIIFSILVTWSLVLDLEEYLLRLPLASIISRSLSHLLYLNFTM